MVDSSIPSVLETLLMADREASRLSRKILTDVQSTLEAKSSDYGPVSSIIDLVSAATGYNRVPVPGSEVLACYRTLTKLVRYMELRTQGLTTPEKAPHFEGLKDTLSDIVGESARLYSAYILDIGETEHISREKIVNPHTAPIHEPEEHRPNVIRSLTGNHR